MICFCHIIGMERIFKIEKSQLDNRNKKVSYKILSYYAKIILTDYKGQTSWCCFGLPDNNKVQYLLELMHALDNDPTLDSKSDIKKETILLVGLTAFNNYLQDKKNEELCANLYCVITDYASIQLVNNEMKAAVDDAKKCIKQYSSAKKVDDARNSDYPLESLPLVKMDEWTDRVIDIMNKRDHTISPQTPVFSV